MNARISRRSMLGRTLGTCGLAAAPWLAGQGQSAHAADAGRLIVHEWGTFTSLQNNDGQELTGINIDDEPVPKFVHNLNPLLLNPPIGAFYRMKAVARRHPMVTMRLETPVIYFYPPKSQSTPLTLDVSARFNGGWLTEFYPNAEAHAPGVRDKRFTFGPLTPDTVSSLTWRDLRVGTDAPGPETEEAVWLAPRRVRAVGVTSAKGESEKYLFYRGVANRRAPLRLTKACKSEDRGVHANFGDVLGEGETAKIGALWLVQVRADGRSAFRTLGPVGVTADENRQLTNTGGSFRPEDFSSSNRGRLHKAMHAALVADGLYADEATALLSTWQRAYFTSPGLRLFFLVPRRWTDHVLPLEISAPADITRVMVGRIELITPEQRQLLERLAEGPVSDAKWINQIPRSPAREKFLAGRADPGDLGIEVPPDYQTYLNLGRFRNALVAAEERRRPTEALTRFINIYGLHQYRWQKAKPAAETAVARPDRPGAQ